MTVLQTAVVTDSTACVPQERVEQYGIEIVPVELIFDGRIYRDGIDITPAEFYERLRQAKRLPTTSGSLPGPYLEAYRQASHRASNILSVTEPSHFSGMFNSAKLAQEMAKTELPDTIIEVLECNTVAAGQGLVVLAAARAAASGKGLTDITETAKKVMSRVHLYAALDTLNYLVKGGRVPKAAALANSLLQIKPVFTINGSDAHTVALPRTKRSAVKHILRFMKEKVIPGQPLHIAVMHANAVNDALALRDRIATQFDGAELFITEFTPVMGAHTGPGLIGVAFYSGNY